MTRITRINERDAYVKLAQIREIFRNEVFDGYLNPTLSGPGVRDALFGGINLEFFWESVVSEYNLFLLRKYGVTNENNTVIVDSKFGKLTLHIANKNDFFWNFDSINFPFSSTYSSIKSLTTQAELIRTPSNAEEAKAQLVYANEICQQYGLKISLESLQKIARVIEKEAPLEKGDFVVGFRAYNVENGYLLGGARGVWKTSKLSVDCPDFRQHIQESVTTAGGISRGENGQRLHACGIYIYKDPTECVHYYGIGKQMFAIAAVVGWGDIWEGERGYRVEHSRIEKLWVLKEGVSLRPYEINGGVIMNAKLNDFYRDIYTSGLDIHTEGSLF